MASFNKVILMGNVTRDPEIRYTPKGTAVAKMSIAVNRTWRNEAGELKEEVTFVDVDVFGRTAENVGKYVRKGNPIFVEGRLKQDIWEDKETHKTRSRMGVVAETVQFLPTAKRAEEKPAAAQPPKSEPAGEAGKPPVEDDDVPF